MLFDLSNTPATFQKYINKILTERLNVFVIVYLNNILIYIKNLGQPYVKAIYWIFDKLQKYSLFANLKKCCFHQDEIHFLGYVVLSKDISIETKKIKVVKNWPEPKLIRNIQVFLDFINFYWQFI